MNERTGRTLLIEGLAMIFWTRGRRLSLAMILLLLVFVVMMFGFLASAPATSSLVALDFRNIVSSQALPAELTKYRDTTEPIIAVGYACKTGPVGCTSTDVASIAKVLGLTNLTTVFTTDKQNPDVGTLLKRIYGKDDTEIDRDRYVAKVISGGFNRSAAIVIIGLLVLVLIVLFWPRLNLVPDRGATPGDHDPDPDRRRHGSVGQAQRPIYRPQPPDSTMPARSRPTSALRPLLARNGGHVTARSHVTADGGYVAIGDVVVWAALKGPGQAVATPGDPLTVLRVDDTNAELLVTSPERGLRP